MLKSPWPILAALLFALTGCMSRQDRITLTADGQLALNGRQVAIEQLGQELKRDEVIVEAEPEVAHARVIDVMQQVQRHTARVQLRMIPPAAPRP